jgi:hypothetical protein
MDYRFEIDNPTVVINDIDISDLLLEAHCDLHEDRGLRYDHGKAEVFLRYQYRVFHFSIRKDDFRHDLIDSFEVGKCYSLTVIKTKRGWKKTLLRNKKTLIELLIKESESDSVYVTFFG